MKVATLLLTLSLYFNFIGQELKIDTKNATVEFEFVSEQAKGKVAGLQAKFIFNPLDFSKSSIKGSVDVSTLTTYNKMRDKHLQKSDMFFTEKFPKMTFESSKFSKKDNGFTADGLVSIKGKTKKAKFNFIKTKKGIVGKMTVYTNDFNIYPKKKYADSKVIIAINLPFQKK